MLKCIFWSLLFFVSFFLTFGCNTERELWIGKDKDGEIIAVKDILYDIEDAVLTDDYILLETTIVSMPENPTSERSARFEFICNKMKCTFKCRHNYGNWEDCESPHTYNDLPEGAHVFEVYATDADGNIDISPAVYKWFIGFDNTPPHFKGIREILSLSDTEVMLFWEPAEDDKSSLSEIEYDVCVSDNKGDCLTNFIPTYTIQGNIFNFMVSNLMPSKIYYFVARARDWAGNVSTNMIELKRELLSKVVAISTGGFHTCVLLKNQTIKCWGDNYYGQLGNGTNRGSVIPVEVRGIDSAVSISAGEYHTCAVLDNHKIKCWGKNDDGQLGNGTSNASNVPTEVVGIDSAVSVSTNSGYSGSHTCALLLDKSIWCWGWNGKGQLGNEMSKISYYPIKVTTIKKAKSVSVGGEFTCAILEDKTVWCWGLNSEGQLGDGSTSNSSVPVRVRNINLAKSISTGYSHSCVLLEDDSVECWGNNYFGQLGNNYFGNSNIPVRATLFSKAKSVSAGTYHTCAVLLNGNVVCNGNNSYGQLGNGYAYYISSVHKVNVLNIKDAITVSCGLYHTCALLKDSTVRCWGKSGEGQLGNGAFANMSNIPLKVVGIDNAIGIAVGSKHYQSFGTHILALLKDQTIKSWGYNGDNQLGTNEYFEDSAIPKAVRGINSAINVSAGFLHSYALLSDYTIKCWGSNWYGQCGENYEYISFIPNQVMEDTKVIAISAGGFHTCALMGDSTIRCWGHNQYGQIGDGTNYDSRFPSKVDGINSAISVSSGGYQSCAILSDHTVRCWGAIVKSNTPKEIQGINTAISLSVGIREACAVLSDQTVWCWGDDETNIIPTKIEGINSAVSVAVGAEHKCVLLSDHTIKCWGSNLFGQIGDGTNNSTNIPVRVIGIDNALYLSVGGGQFGNYDISCAVLSDNTVRCWGSNDSGELGAGYFGNLRTPVPVIIPY